MLCSAKARMYHLARFFLVLALLLLVAPGRAEAYIDPSTGSLAIQIIIGAIAAIVLAVKTQYARIAALSRKYLKRKSRR